MGVGRLAAGVAIRGHLFQLAHNGESVELPDVLGFCENAGYVASVDGVASVCAVFKRAVGIGVFLVSDVAPRGFKEEFGSKFCAVGSQEHDVAEAGGRRRVNHVALITLIFVPVSLRQNGGRLHLGKKSTYGCLFLRTHGDPGDFPRAHVFNLPGNLGCLIGSRTQFRGYGTVVFDIAGVFLGIPGIQPRLCVALAETPC